MKVLFQTENLKDRIFNAISEAQLELSEIALEDCNKFCKVDTGETRASSYKASNLSKGSLTWNTKQARYAYFLGEADASKNPLASRLWAHKAATLYNKKWLATTRIKFISVMSGGGKI